MHNTHFGKTKIIGKKAPRLKIGEIERTQDGFRIINRNHNTPETLR